MIDLTLRCPVCDRRADMCFDHGDEWKRRAGIDPTVSWILLKTPTAVLERRVDEFCNEADDTGEDRP